MDQPGAHASSNITGKHEKPRRQTTRSTSSGNSSNQDDEQIDDQECDSEENHENGSESDEAEDADDEDEEPRLKYVYLTKCVPSLYRSGDATSSLLAGGDNMIVGTHNGKIHVLSIPKLKALRVYAAHSASVTSISISPFLTSRAITRQTAASKPSEEEEAIPVNDSPRPKGKTTHSPALPPTPSNSIHIATASIDGNVCIYSLLDPKDVLLRNFGRPVQAVALSPEYKSDRQYLSGGRAGQLILTVGGRPGTTEKSTTLSGAATATGWLGSLGLSANSGKDTVLHSGEGAINTIKWSLSGKYVAWVNEEGIKIMRSNLHLDAADAEFAWTRIRHIDRPNRPQWEEMASVWRAHAEWVDLKSFENSELSDVKLTSEQQKHGDASETERLIVGWGGTIWVINVYPDRVPPPGTRAGDRKLGDAEVVTILRTDATISGVAMYTPKLLLVLAYLENDESDVEEASQKNRRHKAAEPELRLIDLETQEEISADTISVSRFENLSSLDYHLSLARPPRITTNSVQRGALGTFGTGLLDATLYPARLFTSNASIRSGGSNGDRGSERVAGSFVSSSIPGASNIPKEIQTLSSAKGIKAFIHSPYDFIAAMSRDLSDHLAWLESHQKFGEAWNTIDQNPSVLNPPNETHGETFMRSQTSLAEFFADDGASVMTAGQPLSASARMEKRRIGELWIDQNTQKNDWKTAGEICAKVLDVPDRWEYWTRKFVEAGRFDEIAQYIPVDTRPPLSSSIFNAFLEHYVSNDLQTFEHLLSQWPSELFDLEKAISAVQNCLETKKLDHDSSEWRILMGSLGKLFLESGRHREALRCYIELQDAEEALHLISEYRLTDAISDDVLKFILLRVSKHQLAQAPIEELEQSTAESINILVREAYNGIVPTETVVSQLNSASGRLFLFFYLRSLWKGDSHPSKDGETTQLRGRGRHARDAAEKLAADEGRSLIEPFADIALDLFADYDRQLLKDFLQASTSYSFDEACKICEDKHFTSELIYILSKTGQTKRALHLILSDLNDVSQAIDFAKSQDDHDLWEDLLSYSMNKPAFIHALLTEAGTAIDPIKLVKRIPSGLEIEGLRDGLTRLLRDHDIQASISQGAAKVLQGEVAIGMDALRRGRRRGIKFNIKHSADDANTAKNSSRCEEAGAEETDGKEGIPPASQSRNVAPGHCGGCLEAFHQNEKEMLVGFACGHVFHLSHVQETSYPNDVESTNSSSMIQEPSHELEDNAEDDLLYSMPRTVGPKVITARLIRDKVGEGCRICALNKQVANAGATENA